ncbi:tripartite tricarboxylate transporter TctB family protein [Bradyrhizobium sp. LHD-71]|uniref:tripartite tricarboxylate transporter TctB family protein n=1 Tax=Bradyrhizobium sp. LHD-71 TaxID=3072141 RepID=UPI00280FBDB3|nr:tripartite tricarboxylate transporter TctB family protein [Bradyrhizobium sp. LHD-71]MDQ8729204.1 tripartite tricarboxylate transporter TctB family protein [Bradyrhizobium sp. LHD-71]
MRLTKDLLAGAFFLFLGAGALIVSRAYPSGTASEMGPGYFPHLVGTAIAIIGAVIVVKALAQSGDSITVAQWGFRPMLLILGSVTAFALLANRLGLIIAIVALVAVSRFAARDRGLVEFVILTAVLIAIVMCIFVLGLKVPFRLTPW